MSMFDEMMKDDNYKKLFNKLPDDEKKSLEEALRNFVEDFENRILKPLQNLK